MTLPCKRFFDLGSGNPKVATRSFSSNAYGTGGNSYVAAPASGKRLAIMWMTMSFSGYGANATTTVGFFDGAADTTDPTGTDRMIVDRVSMNGTSRIYPVHLNFSSCPIIGDADQVVKAKKQNFGSATIVTIGYYEVD